MTWMHDQRLEVVIAGLRAVGAETVIDLGCGDGPLLVRLAHEPAIRRIVGVDVSADALAALRKRLAAAPEEVRCKVELRHASMTDASKLTGFDAAILVETIEHIEPGKLSLVERAVFRDMRPALVIVTTPNSDFNALLGVPRHRMRHPDHRFEWGSARFRAWAGGVAKRNGYDVGCENVAGGTQMAVFRLALDAGRAARP
ncbi:MAG TPA: methyltransferase domain-containing protein [Aestuariivirgaceae bacterium]|nr:methyltransferase domain-containing protein [Aestuariivirgaceae bacterium]